MRKVLILPVKDWEAASGHCSRQVSAACQSADAGGGRGAERLSRVAKEKPLKACLGAET